MFERFTDRARRVVVLAQEEARHLRHGWIGTEHILLGLLAEEQGIARQALDALGVHAESVREEIRRIVPPGEDTPVGHVPFTPRAKKVLELSLREALQLGHNYIGTEHILLGVARQGEGVAAQVLAGRGAGLDRVRSQVLLLMSATPGQAPAQVRRWRAPQTAAGDAVLGRARALAGGRPAGSQHYLLAILEDPRSLASKVLSSFGLTAEEVAARVEEMGPAGTSDETPEVAGAKRIQMRVVGGRLELSVDDPELVAGLEAVVVTGTDPAAASFPTLWGALRETTGDVLRRLQGHPEEAQPGEPPAAAAEEDIPLPEWAPATGGGFYAVMSRPDGLVGRLQTAVGIDSGDVRRVLSAWVTDARDVPGPDLGTDCAFFSARVEEGPEGAFVVRDFAFGASGPEDWPRKHLAELLAFAADDLRVRHDDD